jgi:hypothetical protein
MSFQQDRDGITYEEYEFVPMAPMDNTSIPEEMKEFMSMCCMMGMMPMNNLINPMQRSFSLGGVTPFVGKISDDIKNQDIFKEDNIHYEDNLSASTEVTNNQENRSVPNYEELSYFRDKDEYHNNYNRIDRLVDKIEKNNPGIFKYLLSNGISYEKSRKLVRRIVRFSLMYSE